MGAPPRILICPFTSNFWVGDTPTPTLVPSFCKVLLATQVLPL
jgi:hypothetical protein